MAGEPLKEKPVKAYNHVLWLHVIISSTMLIPPLCLLACSQATELRADSFREDHDGGYLSVVGTP